jgi:hypothetical protein
MPSLPALFFRSTWIQRGNYTPILVTVRLYCILQLAVFVFCPWTSTCNRPVDAGTKDIVPSATTLTATVTSLLLSITAEWKGELYCGLTLALDYAPRLTICYDTVFAFDPAIATQFLPPCVCAASFSLLSSSSIHAPSRPAVRAMMGFTALCHLLQHCVSVRPGTSTAIAPQFLSP